MSFEWISAPIGCGPYKNAGQNGYDHIERLVCDRLSSAS